MQSKIVLGTGWGPAERLGSRTYRWIKDLEADLTVTLGDVAGPYEVWLDAAAHYLPYTRQRIALYCNGVFVGEQVCADHNEFEPTLFTVPAGVFREGANEVRFRMGYRAQIGLDPRELSIRVAVILVRKEPVHES